MRKLWLMIVVLTGGGLLAGCASGDGQAEGQRASRGLYVGGGGGYDVH